MRVTTLARPDIVVRGKGECGRIVDPLSGRPHRTQRCRDLHPRTSVRRSCTRASRSVRNGPDDEPAPNRQTRLRHGCRAHSRRAAARGETRSRTAPTSRGRPLTRSSKPATESSHDVAERNEPGRAVAERGVEARVHECEFTIESVDLVPAERETLRRSREEIGVGEPHAECAGREGAVQIELDSVVPLEARALREPCIETGSRFDESAFESERAERRESPRRTPHRGRGGRCRRTNAGADRRTRCARVTGPLRARYGMPARSSTAAASMRSRSSRRSSVELVFVSCQQLVDRRCREMKHPRALHRRNGRPGETFAD